MGLMKQLLMEKIFALSLDGGNCIRITERSRKTTKEMVFSLSSARWMANTLEECSSLAGNKTFYKSYRDGSKALFVHRRTNAFGSYLEITEYGGGGHWGPLVIPEGIEGGGWKYFSREMKQAMPMYVQARMDRTMDKGKEIVRHNKLYAEAALGSAGSRAAVQGGTSYLLVLEKNRKGGMAGNVNFGMVRRVLLEMGSGTLSHVCQEESELQKAFSLLKR